MMKEEALNLADQLDGLNSCEPVIIKACETMIRRLVEELDKQEYRNELLENSIKFAMLANNLQDKQGEPVVYWDGKHFASKEKSSLADIPLYTTPQTKPLKRLNKQEIARYMFSQNTGQDIGQMLIEYFCDKNGLTLEYIED